MHQATLPRKPTFSASAAESLAGYRLLVQQTTIADFDMIQQQVQAAVSPKPHNQRRNSRKQGQLTGGECVRAWEWECLS